MTSSFVLSQLDRAAPGSPHKRGSDYSFASRDAPLGGMEDQYLKLQGECHPDFAATPIGHPNGAKLCTRRRGQCGMPIGQAEVKRQEANLEYLQGYHRGSVNLYDTEANFPTQTVNPQYYADRRMPWEQDLLRANYPRLGLKYSGTGINPLRVPAELRDARQPPGYAYPYFSNGYSFTPPSGYSTGDNPATSWQQTIPYPKYDVTRLHQPYPVWKTEHEYMRTRQEKARHAAYPGRGAPTISELDRSNQTRTV